MLHKKHLHHLIAFAFMLCAVVFSALAPSFSKILNASNPSLVSDVCWVGGSSPSVLTLQVFEKDFSSDDNDMQFDHCDYCVLQNHSPYLPIENVQLSAPLLSSNRLASSGGSTLFFKRFPLEAKLSRAPPVFS